MIARPTVSAFLAVLLLATGGATARVAGAQAAGERPHNVILLIADGMGPASVTMARDYARDVLGRPLALDEIHTGSVRTHSTDSRVTDSAAGATAYATGHKTYNGAIAVDGDGRPLGTILEAAEARGMATGLVATTRLTHATPASFAAHVPDRDMENEIAAQLIGPGVDVLMGGGRRHFVAEDGERSDGRNLLEEARRLGYTVVESWAEAREAPAPLLALVAWDQMAYEVDRDPQVEPALAEMTRRALDLVDDDPDGFFLMVEGSRIDHAGHANDAAAHVHDVLAYDEAVRAALEFARRDGRTLVVSVADHETGGLTLGRDGTYGWQPGVLAGVRASLGRLAAPVVREEMVPEQALEDGAGLSDLDDVERTRLREAGRDEGRLEAAMGEIISRRAGVGWTTGGHTAVDVGLYAAGPGSARFAGSLENDAVGRLLAESLGLDLEAATARLRRGQGSH